MASSKKIVNRAFELIRNYPRVGVGNIKDNPGAKAKKLNFRGQHSAVGIRFSKPSQTHAMTVPRLGIEGGKTPFHRRIPQEPYYEGHHLRRQYPPLSLWDLQRLIDKGMIDPSQPIDLVSFCNTKLYQIEVLKRHYGLNLTDEGADIFCAKVNLEVQWTNELVIAAVERNGGVITTAYYDPISLHAMRDPFAFFKKGMPIPRRGLPPEDALEYYTNPNNRGYLANPDKVREARFELAQKMGYPLPNLEEDEDREMLAMHKDPRQIFYGLAPGWVVNLKDEVILKPTNEQLRAYYNS